MSRDAKVEALVAELADWKGRAERQHDFNVEQIAKQAALEAAAHARAIERAAEVVELWIFTNHERDTQQACAAAIRALKDDLP
jgi:hypothetical protein